ncbi:MAG: AzlD domain-containing protein [Crenarchaeota archaeon]|nr:AzlD domain-containing protein [Thermoproteota archaeon]
MTFTVNIVHLLAIVCVAVVTYLARYLPLRYGDRLGRSDRIVEALRLCTIAVITSLVMLSVLPTFSSFNMRDIVPAVCGIGVGVVLARRMRNVGLVALIGLGVYILVLKLISPLV